MKKESIVITEKTLQNLKGLFLHETMEDKFPLFFSLMDAFFEYLDSNENDENAYFKLTNMLDNIDAETMYPELLESFYQQFFKLLPSDKYVLSDDIKRKLLSYGKWINNSKGTRNIFDFVFNYLQNFTTLDEDGNPVNLRNIIYSIFEEEPFKYRINVTQPIEHIRPFLEDLNIAGFSFTLRRAYSWGDGSSGGGTPPQIIDSVDDLPDECTEDVYLIPNVDGDLEAWICWEGEWINQGQIGDVGQTGADSIRKLKLVGSYRVNKKYTFNSSLT